MVGNEFIVHVMMCSIRNDTAVGEFKKLEEFPYNSSDFFLPADGYFTPRVKVSSTARIHLSLCQHSLHMNQMYKFSCRVCLLNKKIFSPRLFIILP